MSALLITNGRVIDPSQGLDAVTNLLLLDGKVAAYGVAANSDHRSIDATNQFVVPGLIDMHCELREPGREEDETIQTGTAAAIAGGFTTIACLPNTDPPLDTQAGVEFVHQKAARARNCNVFVVACVSKDRDGKEMAELGSLSEAGAVGFSDGARPIHNTELLRRALEYCLMFDRPILSHAEVLELTHGGIMHEGRTSMVLGLAGLPAEAEDVMTSRDIRLAESTGGRLHLMNISTSGSVEMLRRAKHRKARVTAGICAANLMLNDENLRTFDANFKVNPPLRSQDHIDACLAGLADGTIDVIASGHAPRASEKKMRELDQAPFGMSMLETTLALIVTKLIEPGHLSWSVAIEKLSMNPAKILGLSDKGTLRVGADADVSIIDPRAAWTVDRQKFRSKSSNSPFHGWQLRGRATQVIVGGEPRL